MVATPCVRWAVLATALVVFASRARATHYPDGSLCYDCHAVSKGKMVAGTHLIKASQRTTDLGIVAGSTTMRCLFCHTTDAVSAPLTPGRVMRPVDAHFSSASLSKHRASIQSTVLAQDPTQFDCKDCHVAGTENSVTSDANGDTFVHGRDAKTQQINVYRETLLGAPSVGTPGVYVSPTSLTPAQKQTLSSATCANVACHNATAPVSFGNYTAPKRHGYAKGISLNDVAGSLPADQTAGCLACHGTHNSVDGTSLLVLKNTSGASGKAATNATVTPNECEVCHTQDENGGLTNNFTQYGHGKVGIDCSTCHDVSHVGVSGNWLSGTRLRPELTEDATAGTSTFGTSFASNCKKCHSGHAAHTPTASSGGFKGSTGYATATGRSAGCRDCHDQHGTTAADTTAQNDKMIRRNVGANGALPAEDTRLPLGRTSRDSLWFVSGQTYGACDNRSCHDKLQTAGPTATLATATAHLGGALSASSCSNSAGCHTTHLTAPAPDQFAAAQDCDGCHAANGVGHTRAGASSSTHGAHVGSPYVSGTCNRCHPHNGPGTTGDAAHWNGTVDFGGTYMTAAFNYPASGGSLSDANCATAANGCHNAPAASWAATSLIQCQDCHAAAGKLLDQGGWPVASNKHAQHLSSNSLPHTATGGCFACHDATVDSAGVLKAGGAHANNQKDVAFNAAYGYEGAAATRTETGAATTCATVRCHNGVATPSWASSSTIACGQCHNTGGTGPVPSGVSVAGSHARHASNAWPNTDCDNCHGDAANKPSATYTATGGGGGLHQNLAVDLYIYNGAGTYVDANTKGGVNWSPGPDGVDNGTCATTNCHGAGTPTWGGVLAGGCFACHPGTGTEPLAKPVEATGNGPNVVIQAQYESTGHGNATVYSWDSLSGAAFSVGNGGTPNKGCYECHDPASKHTPAKSAADPYRLGATYAGNADGLCADCHGASATNPKKAASALNLNIVGHSKATTASAKDWPPTGAVDYAYKCVDCHDPHGDTNHFMVRDAVSAPTAASDAAMGSNDYGTPLKADSAMSAVTFTSLAGYASNSYAVSGAANGICEVCHNQTSYYRRADPSAQTHNAGARCTDCHQHNGGFRASCAGCHGYPPPESPSAGTTVSWISDRAATPASVGEHASHASGATPYVAGDCNATCHVTGTHAQNKTTANMGARATTVAASTGVYKYSTLDNFDTWLGGAQAGNLSIVDDSCTNVSCHNATYAANSFRSAANPSYVRYWDKNLNCYSCHGYDGVTASAPRPTADAIASGSHTKHVQSGAYALACTNCHPSAGYTTSHKSGVVDFAANLGATRIATVTGGFYDVDGIAPFATAAPTPKENGNGYYCANAYCHSGGTVRGTTPTIAYANTTKWGTAASGACGTCHGVDGQTGTAAVMASNVHAKHTATGGYGYACTTCHSGVVVGARPTYTIASYALHVNGTNDVNFGTNEGTYAAATGGTVGPLGGTCTATYCHSQGLDWTAPYTGAGTAALTTPDWDTGAATITCGYCHGSPPSYANNTSIQPGATAYPKKNSHASHANYSCDRCHYGTTTTGTTITNPALHANKAYDLTANTVAGVSFTVTIQGGLAGDVYTPTSCGTISCHNGGSAQWGAALGCTDCHFRTTAQGGDLDNWNLADGAASAVNSDEWTYSGHGRTGTVYDVSGNPAAAFAGPTGDASGCGYCHDASVAHGTAANPFRLRNAGVVSGTANESQGWNDACLICHKTGQTAWGPAGYTAKTSTSLVDKDHYGTKHSAATQGGVYCWDCHDPHGDRTATGGNIFMVQRTATKASNGTTGIPVTTVALTFTAATTGTDYAQNGPSPTGVCNVCHTATSHYTATTGDGHNSSTKCTGCHDHRRGFSASCTSCHGNTTAGSWWPDSTAEHGTAYPNRLGDHQQHVDAIAVARFGASATVTQKNTTCDTCHPNPGSSGHNTNTAGSLANTADVHRDSQNASTHFKTISGAANGVLTESYNNATTANGKACSNVDCHYRATTPVSGTATANGDGWYQPTAAATCTTCHGNGTVGAALPNSHPVHVATTAGKGLGCWNCHPSGVNNANYTTSHQTGAVNWSFADTLDPATGGPRAETYNALATGTTTVKYGAGTFATCAATYCHGNFAGGTVANAPTWGTAATGQCGTCHPGNGTGNLTVMNDANHTDHLTAAYGPNFTNTGCTGTATTGCHTGNALTDATHGNGTVDFANVVTTTSAAAVLGTTAPAGAPDATSTDRCNRCHSTATVGGSVGAVLAKTNWSNAAYKVPCLNCHNAAGAATQFANGAGVAAPAKDPSWTTGGHGRTTAFPVTGNPAPNYACTVCHDETLGHVSGVLGDTNRFKAVTESPALAYTDAVSEVCLDCHKVGQATAPAAGAGRLGYDATNEATVHSGGVTGKYTTSALAANAFPAYGDSANYAANPGYQCRACHDPHGTTKLAMVLATIDGKAKGVSNPKAVTAAFDAATATSLVGLDPTAAADDGVCDVCHNATGTTTPHPDTAHPGNHNQGGTGQSCMGCHDHKKSFQGGCTSCHGNTTAGNWWPDSTTEHGTAYPNRLGDHQQHVDAIAVARFGASPTVTQKNTTCDTCHPNPGSSGHDTNTTGSLANTADVHRDPQNASTHFKTISGAANGVLTESYNNAVTANGKACSNVDCHYRATTPVSGTATANGDGWYQPTAVATCTTCHGNGTVGAALPNAHARHVGTAAGQKAYPCTYCHPSGTYTTSHQTGAVDWSFAATLDPGGTRTETYNALATGATTVKYGTGTFATCTNVYCHIQTSSPAWDATIPAVNGCTNCHTVNGAAAYEPKSGLHGIAQAGVQKHDNTLATNGCSECHVTETATHVDGTFVADSGANTDRWVTRAGLTWTDGAANRGTCSGTGLDAASGCHSDSGNWSRLWSTEADSTATNVGATRCNVCHGQWSTIAGSAGWAAGTTHYKVSNTSTDARGKTHDGSPESCDQCHAYATAPGKHNTPAAHLITVNGTGTTYARNATSVRAGCSACHEGAATTAGATTAHDFPQSVFASETAAGPTISISCEACHAPGGSGPTVVWPAGNRASPPANVTGGAYGSHLVALKTDTLSAATSWSTQCNKCHTGHTGTVIVPLPPASWSDPSGTLNGANMQTRLGIGYTAAGGIRLGGTATTGTTEAEVCWNCHANASNNVSEWGFNTRTVPTGFPVVAETTFVTNGDTVGTGQGGFDFGWIYSDSARTTKASNWVTGGSGTTNPYWKSPYDATLTMRIASVHTTSFDAAGQSSSVANNIDASGNVTYTSPVLENVSYIRCSQCHDVHDLNKAAGPPADAAAGKPFLRGAWVGDPYPPDMPPLSTYTYPTTGGPTGQGNRANAQQTAMPRYVADSAAANSSRGKGGYFLDQNSGNPTANSSMNSVDKAAGLCELCHGTNVDTMKFYSGSTLWRFASPKNGHSNAVLGGTGANKSDLFDARRGATTNWMGNQDRIPNPNLGSSPGSTALWPWGNLYNGSGSNRSRNSGWFGGTSMGSGSVKGGGDYANWYAAGTVGSHTGTAGGKAHDFTCSKCHSPHATGLPALLITNCLDKTLATWSANTNNVGPNSTHQIQNNNCHRKESGTPGNTGWHRLNAGQKSP